MKDGELLLAGSIPFSFLQGSAFGRTVSPSPPAGPPFPPLSPQPPPLMQTGRLAASGSPLFSLPPGVTTVRQLWVTWSLLNCGCLFLRLA